MAVALDHFLHVGFQLRLPLAVWRIDIYPAWRVALWPARLAQADTQDDFGMRGFGLFELPIELAEIVLARCWLGIAPIADEAEVFNTDVQQGIHGRLGVDAEARRIIGDEANAHF